MLLLQRDNVLFALRPSVRVLIARILRSEPSNADVEDCTSETLRRALEDRDRLREGAPLRPWLLGIARHVALDALRARALARARSSDGGEDPFAAFEGLRDDGLGPYEQIELAERTRFLQRALESLPREQALALLLHAQGRGYREIAVELAVPMGTICSWIARARKHLDRTLDRTS